MSHFSRPHLSKMYAVPPTVPTLTQKQPVTPRLFYRLRLGRPPGLGVCLPSAVESRLRPFRLVAPRLPHLPGFPQTFIVGLPALPPPFNPSPPFVNAQVRSVYAQLPIASTRKFKLLIAAYKACKGGIGVPPGCSHHAFLPQYEGYSPRASFSPDHRQQARLVHKACGPQPFTRLPTVALRSLQYQVLGDGFPGPF